MTSNPSQRNALKSARRIVVKVGSKVLVQGSGRPNPGRIKLLVDDIARLQNDGAEVVFVSSGAVAAGQDALGIKTRPQTISDLHMAAAVGQMHLMSMYENLFGKIKRPIQIGQVLLTHDALKQRHRHMNARNTLMNLIAHRIIPIINENDVISTREIEFGDNDVLAALVAILIDADALVLLSTTDGLREPGVAGKTRRVPYIEEVDDSVLGLVNDKLDRFSTGGMTSKLQSAQIAASNGIPVVIADGRKSGVLARVFQGDDEGTLLLPKTSNISKRKCWIAFFNRAEGHVAIDSGAALAISKKNSLLPVGIRVVEGEFNAGAMVNIQSLDGSHIARGLVEYSSSEILNMRGKKTSDRTREIIHRRNIVVP